MFGYLSKHLSKSHGAVRQTYPEPTPQDTPSNPLIMQWGALNVECIVSCVTFLICVSSKSHHECLWNRKLKKWHVRASMDLLCPTHSLGWKLVGLTYHQNTVTSFHFFGWNPIGTRYMLFLFQKINKSEIPRPEVILETYSKKIFKMKTYDLRIFHQKWKTIKS